MTQNNHLVGARLDKTRTSRIRSLSGELQTVSGRNLPAEAGWETGTDITAPRGRPRTSPQQLPELPGRPDFLPASLWFCGRVERNSRGPGVVCRGPFQRFPFFLWSSGASPISFPTMLASPLPENRAGRIDFLPGLLAFWFLWSAGGSMAQRSRLPGSPPPFGVEKSL